MFKLIRFCLMSKFMFEQIHHSILGMEKPNPVSQHDLWIELSVKVAILHKLTPMELRPYVEGCLKRLAAQNRDLEHYGITMNRAIEHFQVCTRIETMAKDISARLSKRNLI